jgi:hypothetical protein
MAVASGPQIVTSNDVICIFTSSGSFIPTFNGTVEVLVVAGGGGGGMDMGGGGGGGGVLSSTAYSVTAGNPITVTVGAGGNGAPAAGTNGQPSGHQYTIPATNGGNSVFGSLTAIGGGFGGSSYRGYTPGIAGGNGGSGGGASGYNDNAGTFYGGTGTAGQGNRGGNSTQAYYSGGGGGAGGAGADSTNQPNGGPGILNKILGPGFYWGGGGGGSAYSASTGGNGGIGGGGGGAIGTTTGGAGYSNGSPGGGGAPNSWGNSPGGNGGRNTGGGGGGGSHYNANNKGGDGGSGIVIVRFSSSLGTAIATNGNVVNNTNGLVMYYDMNNPQRSWKGKPTTNVLVDTDNLATGNWGYTLFGNWPATGATANAAIAPDGTQTATRLSASGYSRFQRYAVSANQTYTFSMWVKNFNMTGGIGLQLATGLNGSLVAYGSYYTSVSLTADWARYSYTITIPSSGVNQLEVGLNVNANSYNSSVFCDVWRPQLELQSFATPWVAGTRSSTQSILDLTNNGTITINSLSYESTGTFSFNGSTDYFTYTPNTSFNLYCLDIWIYNNNAVPNNDSAIGGPSSYQQPVTFNDSYYGVALGGWTGGATNEALQIYTYDAVSGYKMTYNKDAVPVGWHNWVFNWNGTTYDIWADGKKTTTYAHSQGHAGLQNITNLIIGRTLANPYFLNGRQPSVKCYGSQLTDAQVLSNFNAIKAQYAGPFGLSSINPAESATALQSNNPSIANGMYWLRPAGTATPFRAYCDFTSTNGPWVHVGTAVGNTRGLYTYRATWASKITDSGDITNPYDTTTSNFNAASFINCKGSKIMIKYSTTGYVQASGFNNESWRDVYTFLNSLSAWPAYNTYQRELTITERGGVVTGPTVSGAGILYGTEATGSALTTYAHWYVYAFDSGGDTYGYLATGTYGNTGIYSEADHGIGTLENGPSVSTFPGDDQALATNSFDAGTNDVTDSGADGTYNNIPFSLWIKN